MMRAERRLAARPTGDGEVDALAHELVDSMPWRSPVAFQRSRSAPLRVIVNGPELVSYP